MNSTDLAVAKVSSCCGVHLTITSLHYCLPFIDKLLQLLLHFFILLRLLRLFTQQPSVFSAAVKRFAWISTTCTGADCAISKSNLLVFQRRSYVSL